MKLVLVRHPPVAVAAGACYGATDVPLARGWEAWSREVARLCAALEGRVVCRTSPASRCLLPATRLGLEVASDTRLREMDFGAWEGRRWRDITAGELARWRADLLNVAPPQGERLRDLHQRAAAFLDSARGFNGDAMVAVTHGGPIRCMLAEVLGMPIAQLFRLRVDLGSVSAITLQASADVVEFLNFKLRGAPPEG